MTLHRSKAYDRIHDETWEQYKPNVEELRGREYDRHWLKVFAPKWRNRVGMPRLIAEAVLAEASGLVRSINPGLFRNDYDTLMRFHSLRDQLSEFHVDFARENWRRFEGGGDRA